MIKRYYEKSNGGKLENPNGTICYWKDVEKEIKHFIDINNNQLGEMKSINDVREKYNELIMAVKCKFADRSRHDLALEYIKSFGVYGNNPIKENGHE